MKAIVQDRYGGPETWQLRDLPDPVPGRCEVLVRVRAAGLDRGTWHLMTGRPLLARLALGLRRPRTPTPGRDLAGVVAAVGEGVTRFVVGDEVYGTGNGSFGELVVTKEARLAPKPASLTFDEAAAVPISGLTAQQALRIAGVTEGQRVLVIGASGGVGSFAVQLARAAGAHVTGVCRTDKVDFVRSLGAEHVIDHTRESLCVGPLRYDVVLDIAGNRPVRDLRSLLTPTGTLVIVGGEGGGPLLGGIERQLGAQLRSMFVKHRLRFFVNAEKGEDLPPLTALADAGSLRPALDGVFDLTSAADAMRRLESGEVRGKVVLSVA